jgi:hypothetical protein
VKIYLYPLPRKFTYGVVERFWAAKGLSEKKDDPDPHMGHRVTQRGSRLTHVGSFF